VADPVVADLSAVAQNGHRLEPVSDVLDETYLPFPAEQLREHFAAVGTDKTSADRHLDYYRKSAQAYRDWGTNQPAGSPAQQAQAKRRALQMQKDERFWIVTALMSIFHPRPRLPLVAALLRRCLGDVPPMDGLSSWEQALGSEQELRLFFEVSLPTPPEYRHELAQHLDERVLVRHVLQTATKTAQDGHALEGATKVDAMLIAPETGFAVLFEAKVLADASCGIGFDVLRNQLARNIDVMLQPNLNLQKPLTQRRPERTCFVLITPEIFRDHPESRLYGWLMRDYQHHPAALRRDLPHRTGTDFASVATRLGWLSWEDCNRVLPGACSWLPARSAGTG
jgi:hypothetical protein